MLTLDRLTLRQGDFTLSADLSLPAGRFAALIGASGSGKSTLLAAIAGFLAPTSGHVLWDGRLITSLPPAQRPVAMLFQEHNLFPHLTLAENAGLALGPARRHARAPEVAAALARVGLDGLGGRRPGEVSGGQRSRAALARVLLQQKPLVLMDEPFAALGPGMKAEMLALVADVLHEHGRTLVMVTHDPDDAKAICDETMVIDGGRVLPPTPTEALFANPPQGLSAYLGAAEGEPSA